MGTSVEVMGEKIAVIIAIEQYSQKNKPNIKNVDYAKNDAEAFKNLLIEQFEFKEANIHYWVNEDALLSTVSNELPYIIKNLSPNDSFFFYYAGHGYYNDGHNCLTLYDSHQENLTGTTASFQDSLLGPLSKNPCEKAFLFIDACATHLLKNQKARNTISDMSEKEFKKYVKKSTGHACFFSCSAGQKSYPSQKLKHGIWTWHLLEALSGQVDKAIERDNIVTANSLKNYLSNFVPVYLTKETKIRGNQEPYSVIATNTTLEIIELIKEEFEDVEDISQVSLKTEEYQLRRIEDDPYKNYDGFVRGRNTVPKGPSSSAESWAERLAQEEIKDEIEEVYKNAKRVFGYRKKECEKDSENGFLATPPFRYTISATQSEDDYECVRVSRMLELRIELSLLPDSFDEIFPKRFDDLYVPISGDVDFDDLIEKFEDLEDNGKGELEDEDNKITFYPSESEGVSCIIIDSNGITVHFSTSTTTINKMIGSTQEAFGLISSPIKQLLE